MGQLKTKFYGNNNHSAYEYNIRSWLVAQWNPKFIQINVYNSGSRARFNGNQLASVNSGVKFTYDRNGNQKTDSGGTLFKYNYLNLCEEISNFGGALYVKQTYTSDGVKRTMTGKNFTLEYLGSSAKIIRKENLCFYTYQ